MPSLKSSPTLRWERREKDEKEMLASEQKVSRQLLGKLLWIDRAGLSCARGKTSLSLGRASNTDMTNIKSILRYFRGNPGIVTVRPTTLNLEDVKKRNPVGSVWTYGDSDLAGDADRLSVSGTASWSRGRVELKTVNVALSSGEAELVAALSGACEGRRRMRRHNRSCGVTPLQRWVRSSARAQLVRREMSSFKRSSCNHGARDQR